MDTIMSSIKFSLNMAFLICLKLIRELSLNTIKNTTSDEDNTFTQFAYACNQLGTSIECSSTPEFKPRIEMLFLSFQSRLIPELRLSNITSFEEANAFLPSSLDKYNSKFALHINNTKSIF